MEITNHEEEEQKTKSIPEGMEPVPVNIDIPRWDQTQFIGRLNHFIRITNPFLSFKTDPELHKAKYLVDAARLVTNGII